MAIMVTPHGFPIDFGLTLRRYTAFGEDAANLFDGRIFSKGFYVGDSIHLLQLSETDGNIVMQIFPETEDATARDSIGVVPLAIPIVAGPGTMATVLVAAQQNPSILGKGEISIAILAIAALTGILFSFATPIADKLGKSGMGVVTRVMGMILAAIAMGMLAEGLKGILPGLAS